MPPTQPNPLNWLTNMEMGNQRVRRIASAIRIGVGAVILAALIAQLVFTWAIYAGVPRYLIKYFSFFTVQSNLLAVGALLLGAWYGITRTADPARFTVLRLAVTVYMLVTAVVYHMPFNVITLDQPVTVTWANSVLHLAAPIYLLLDWLFAPGRQRVPFDRFWIVMTYPVGWIIYTLVRAPLVSWYPYPFLNPRFSAGGNLTVAVYVAVIALFIALVDLVMIAASKLPLATYPAPRIRTVSEAQPRMVRPAD